MTNERISIAPSPDLILAEIAREGMTWEKALGEPIDNSLDAGATRIVITIDKKAKRVKIQDNGAGCATPHIMLVSGHTTKRGAKNALGRYGVGLKHSSYYFCGRHGATQIVTSFGDKHQSIGVVWDDIIKSGIWEINAPASVSHEEAATILIDGRGTSIEFLGVRCGFLAPNVLDDILGKLAFIFSPALRYGRQIEIDRGDGKRKTLSAPRDPSWSESIEFDVEIEHRKAHVRAGILALNDKSGRRGMSFGYGHRIIVADTSDGCGTYSTAGFAGMVDLDSSWNLGQNKSQVIDEAWPKLCEQIEKNVRPLLEKLKNSTHQLQSEAIRGALSDQLNSGFVEATGQPKRPNRNGEKSTKEKTTNRTVRRATIVDGVGEAIGKRSKGGKITIDFIDEPDTEIAARVDPNGRRISLNRSIPRVERAIAEGDNDFLALLAAAHYAAKATTDAPLFDNYSPQLGRFLLSGYTMTTTANRAS